MSHVSGKKPEIVAPGGSFSSAIAALRNGADAVYTGLPRFSARRFASNLNFEQLRRVLEFSRQCGKHIYITLNTVIKESELHELILLLYDLSAIGIQGIIIQDFGLLEILRTSFPGIRIHASTQLAAHNSYGVKALADLGVKRVILARELGFDEIKAIRRACPDIELEVFIHGSLCYSFSGLCLASGILANRSGNRGECAQVCRSWFDDRGRPGYYFSCNDLALKEHIEKLIDIGIDAFKIEGRMKPPAYVRQVCGYYRAIIDRQEQGGFDSSALVFSRKPTTAFFNSRKGDEMINTRFPSHLGLELGKVIDVRGNWFSITCCRDIEVHDGLLFFRETDPRTQGVLPEPIQFGISEMRIGTKPVFSAGKGETVWIAHTRLPGPGQTIYQISSGELRQADINENGFPPCRIPLCISLRVFDDAAEADIVTPGGMHSLFRIDIHAELSQKEFPLFEKIQSEFKRPGESLFYAADVVCENKTSFPANRIFIPPSVIKKIRQGIFAFSEKKYGERKQADANALLETFRRLSADEAADPRLPVIGQLPLRSSISGCHDPIPFLDESRELLLSDFFPHIGFYYASLPPVSFDPEQMRTRLFAFVSQFPDKQFILGLNNIAHFVIADAACGVPNLFFFADFFLYCANHASLYFLLKQSKKILFSYFWIEGDVAEYGKMSGLPDSVLRLMDDAFNPPLFLSRVCYLKHAQGNECGGCTKAGGTVISMGGKWFWVVVRNCITFLFREHGKKPGRIG